MAKKIKTKKQTIKVCVEYEIEYQHNEHRDRLIKQLCENFRHNSMGAGVASDGGVYHYSLKEVSRKQIV